MVQPVLGIMTLYLNDAGRLEERSIYQKMSIVGRRLGLDIFVFTPDDVNYETNKIHAHIYDSQLKTWSRKWRSFPHMIFDRCRIQRSPRFERLQKFRKQYGHLTFLNRVLRNKYTVYRTLKLESVFRPHLPDTRLYESSSDLSYMIRKYPLVYLKPINGTGGRGILRIEKQRDNTYLIQGRDQSRRIISPQRVPLSSLNSRLASWNLKENRYLVQQGIQLKLPSGRVHDYRMLVQKNGQGKWEVTGCAGRVGPQGSITSNLHGGGEAVTMLDLMRQWISSEDVIDTAKQKAEDISLKIAAHLESTYGRLCELALDLAIDRSGHIWLIEVNPKPAREVFVQAGEKEIYRTAITRPLEYAVWLYGQKKRRQTASSSLSSANQPSQSVHKTNTSTYTKEKTVQDDPSLS
ncbi:glutathione synthase/RimK-type ligase-like ATP-grasp enzyme [Paenibacillus phyllosphaerae]|uniref:Glutathione synthase/RimK-type ligase-like ATP-grasp enzyme n=1 Tax=Paenibacillus phyllosphaerae TaxID=274593 RepID=A0A7W5FKU5_9BACL|nr:YheC/YheD family protein [Paenibacillus phyllosphaerae]MBB3108282.1 glutathione synthase/RimK-type ligase-like ATP-grasp enzyme [Paenibacillus phyllosphaerae]